MMEDTTPHTHLYV